MAEQVHPLTLAEDAFVTLASQLHKDAIARADAEFSKRMAVFCRQLDLPDGTRFGYAEPVAGVIPGRLIYHTPDIPQTPVAAATEASA